MPITKSAKKAWRQSLRKRARNFIYKTKIKNLIKEIRSLVLAKKIEEAKKLLPQVYKILDKAAKVRVIKKNTATRKKSRIARLVNRFKLS
jgi:small subunit ribosomal protein S20